MLGAASFDFLGNQEEAFRKQPLYRLLVTLEELLEMSGQIMLVYTLLSLLRDKYKGLTIILPGRMEDVNDGLTEGAALEQLTR